VSKNTLIYEQCFFDIAAAQSAAIFRLFAISEQKQISRTVLYKMHSLPKLWYNILVGTCAWEIHMAAEGRMFKDACYGVRNREDRRLASGPG